MSARHMRSATDCRAYRGIIRWDSDHTLIALSLRLSLRAHTKRQQRRPWDSRLLAQPEAREEFCLQLENKLSLLQPLDDAADSQQEYSAFVSAMTEAASADLQLLQPTTAASSKGKPRCALSKRTQGLLAAAQQAHKAWLRSRSAAARSNSRKAQRQADRAVQLDMQQWIIGQADEADQLLQQRNMRGFAQAARGMAGQQQ
jgi:hypothetical protein